MVSMKNAKGGSTNPISNIINSLVPKLQFTVTGSRNVGVQGTGKGSVKPSVKAPVSTTPKLQVSGSGQAMPGAQGGTTAPVTLHNGKDKCADKNLIQKVFNLC